MTIDGMGGIGGGLGASGAGRIPSIGEESGARAGGAEGQAGGFASLLQSLGRVAGEADGAVNDLAVGGDRDLHDVVLAVEMESLAFDLAVQIRNRMVDAYHEIFRMQV